MPGGAFCFGPSSSSPEEDGLPQTPHAACKKKGRSRSSLTALLGSLSPLSPVSSSSKSSNVSPEKRSRTSSVPSNGRISISAPFLNWDLHRRSISIGTPLVFLRRRPSSPQQPSDRQHLLAPSPDADSMDISRLAPPREAVVGRLKQVQEAKQTDIAVRERAKRFNLKIPPYDLLELIGKGSFGRVFKSRSHDDQSIVAVKIMDVDSTDYKLDPREKDETIKDIMNEVSVLQALKDSKAKNINLIYEAFSFHSQLWIVSEYCPGGSVHTLMKASVKPGLEEKFIIPICRELAVALKFVHAANIIHRDIKAANVLIRQDGQVQLCDFGVSGILQSNMDKRNTIIGTPFWMPPEMQGPSACDGYGTEIDLWEYGCTAYEMATGQPPNARIAPNKLHLFLQQAPTLVGDEYSATLKEFIAFCLEVKPEKRPSADDILRHTYIAASQKRYPTTSLRQLIERYATWEQQGGQRQSLFNGYGAAGPDALKPEAEEDGDWNFSTTDDFAQDLLSRFAPEVRDEQQGFVRGKTPFEKAQEEQASLRAKRNLDRLFDEHARPYSQFHNPERPLSDLPLRNAAPMSVKNRETIIDLDAAFGEEGAASLDSLSDIPTMKAPVPNRFYDDNDDDDADDGDEFKPDSSKRATKDWKFPSSNTMPSKSSIENLQRRTQDWTFASATKVSRDETIRRTQDWTFATATQTPPQENPARRTQDWSFAAATKEAAEKAFQPPDESPEPPAAPFIERPRLRHMATEPLGSIGDFVHNTKPPSLSLEPPDRESKVSLIDLDLAAVDDGMVDTSSQSRPSTADSSTTDATKGDPFDLEENVGTLRPSHRASMHIHSQSEPSAQRDSASDLDLHRHTRGSSLSTESESRVFSVRESVTSLRREVEAEDWYDEQYIANADEPYVHATDEPLLTAYPEPPPKDDLQKRFRNQQSSSVSHSSIDALEPQQLTSRRIDDPARAGGFRMQRSATTAVSHPRRHDSRGRRLYEHSHHKTFELANDSTTEYETSLSRSASRHEPSAARREQLRPNDSFVSDYGTSFTSTSSYQSRPSKASNGGAEYHAERFSRRHGRVMSFPEPAGPHYSVLQEDAELDTVVAELDRLLEDFGKGLDVAGAVCNDRNATHNEYVENKANGTRYRLPAGDFA